MRTATGSRTSEAIQTRSAVMVKGEKLSSAYLAKMAAKLLKITETSSARTRGVLETMGGFAPAALTVCLAFRVLLAAMKHLDVTSAAPPCPRQLTGGFQPAYRRLA